MSVVKYCYIKKEYYKDHPQLKKILDIGDENKYGTRTHMCLSIKFQGNTILIPLRKNLGEVDRAFGKIGYPTPSKSKPNAGLDYRYIMIVNDEKYLKYDTPRISRKQIKLIEDNYDTIEKEALSYIKAYIKVANKGRVDKTARFRESSLINYHSELLIEEKK